MAILDYNPETKSPFVRDVLVDDAGFRALVEGVEAKASAFRMDPSDQTRIELHAAMNELNNARDTKNARIPWDSSLGKLRRTVVDAAGEDLCRIHELSDTECLVVG